MISDGSWLPSGNFTVCSIYEWSSSETWWFRVQTSLKSGPALSIFWQFWAKNPWEIPCNEGLTRKSPIKTRAEGILIATFDYYITDKYKSTQNQKRAADMNHVEMRCWETQMQLLAVKLDIDGDYPLVIKRLLEPPRVRSYILMAMPIAHLQLHWLGISGYFFVGGMVKWVR